jgi:hypothetical protein
MRIPTTPKRAIFDSITVPKWMIPAFSALLKTTDEKVTGTVPAAVIYRAIDVVHGREGAP